ncbi:MAG: alpha/beta hydrolase [Acidimicrobiia bacterium]|nr:alpha/beta hydrolase [Acidimicrobiia bacterium]
MNAPERPDEEIAALVVDHLDEARELAATVTDVMGTPPSFATPEGLEQLRSGNLFGEMPDTDVIERTVPGPAGPLHVRIAEPPADPIAVYLHIHGGGWCAGSATAADTANVELARTAGVAVVSVDYRLAPEHPWPAPADDVEAVATWLLGQGAGEFGTQRLALGGDSAGAHLAAVTALRLRDRHDAIDRLVAVNLTFGIYDLGMTPSQRQASTDPVLPRAALEACYEHLLPGQSPELRRDPDVSPLYADLAGLCPALVSVGTRDPLLDDSLFMAERWAMAGNPCRLDVYPEGVHGFSALPIELGTIARRRMDEWVRTQVAAAG